MASFACVLYGATGDLAKRKTLPARYEAHRADSVPAAGVSIGVVRRRLDASANCDWQRPCRLVSESTSPTTF
ncbi:hypothetical protein [Paraburkholderia sp. WC7.3g]|uniref:hypothetical protein n=1 Tax=Paraburkholderia sp. WC7.3g TaxID=2991070 RepID=UPI003D216CFC